MKRTLGILSLVASMALSATVHAASTGMKDGLWEISTTTEMPDMPFTPPPMTITHCYTKEDLKSEQQVIPKQDGDCTLTDIKRSGKTTSWKIVCTGENAGKGEGELTFKSDSAYEGMQKFTTKEFSFTSTYKAKRLGPCN